MSTTWYNIYLPLWITGQMTIEQLQIAKTKGRITESEYNAIIETPQNPA